MKNKIERREIAWQEYYTDEPEVKPMDKKILTLVHKRFDVLDGYESIPDKTYSISQLLSELRRIYRVSFRGGPDIVHKTFLRQLLQAGFTVILKQRRQMWTKKDGSEVRWGPWMTKATIINRKREVYND